MDGIPITLESGTVTCVDDFLNAEECVRLTDDLQHIYWWDSPVIRRDSRRRLVSGHSISRTSSTTDETWLSDESRQVLRSVEQKLAVDFRDRRRHY